MSANEDFTAPLTGVKVIELGALVASPYAGMLLADLGAEVIKVEPPEGDMARAFAPFVNGESAFFMAVNRTKKSVVLDVKKDRDLQILHELIKEADVLIHNYRTGVAERIGLGYEELSQINSRLVYCAVSGFGPDGPMSSRPAIDLLFQAESGMLAITGNPDGPPSKVGTNAADVYSATTATVAILAALFRRTVSGKGCRVDVSARDAFVALQACWVSSFFATGEQQERLGAGSPFTAPTDVYPTGDGEIVLAVVNEKHWRIFCSTLGLEEYVDDPRFASNELRVAHGSVLRELVSRALADRSTQEWLDEFAKAQIPAGRVYGYADLEDDAQIAHNHMIVGFDHPTAGPVRTQGIPFWFNKEKTTRMWPAPTLGQHNSELDGGSS